jgi:hypothetical protein
MWRDPIVEEVRAIRRRLAAECDFDIQKLIQRAREVQKTWPGGVVTKEELRRYHQGAPYPYTRER